MTLLEEANATIPANLEDLEVGEERFYVVNSLVPERDGSRILGPCTSEELGHHREKYQLFQRTMSKSERKKFPFMVYKLIRTE